MKVNINQLLSTNYSKDKQFENRMLQRDNCLVGWVDSYNSENHTINVQPAIQSEIVTAQQTTMLKNKPFLINCPVISNTLSRPPQKGDKALILVLDEKSNNFFKTAFDTNKPIEQQTLVNQSKAYKTLSNCVAFVINPNPVEGGGGSTSLNSLKFEPSNEGLQYQDGKATATGNFIYTTTESDTPISITGSIQSNIIGGDGVVVDADETSTNLEIHLDSNVLTTEPQTFTLSEQEQVRQNIGAGTSDFSGNYNDLTNLPDIAIAKLVGTSDNPINLGLDTEVGKVYCISGVVQLTTSTQVTYNDYFLINRINDGILGYNIYISTNQILFRDGIFIRVYLNSETGYVTASIPYSSIYLLNGQNNSSALSFYAPTSGGTAGQFLQSNGSTNAPTWVTADYASSADLETKLDKNQGSENAGKVLTVGDDGIVTPQDSGGSGINIKTETYQNVELNSIKSTLFNLIQNNKFISLFFKINSAYSATLNETNIYNSGAITTSSSSENIILSSYIYNLIPTLYTFNLTRIELRLDERTFIRINNNDYTITVKDLDKTTTSNGVTLKFMSENVDSLIGNITLTYFE